MHALLTDCDTVNGLDVFRMLTDLQRLGLTNADVARGAGIDARTLGCWKNGFSMPTLRLGVKFITFYVRRMLESEISKGVAG